MGRLHPWSTQLHPPVQPADAAVPCTPAGSIKQCVRSLQHGVCGLETGQCTVPPMCPVVVCGSPFLATFRGPNSTRNLLQNHCTQRHCCPDTEQQNLGTIADALTLRPILDLLFKVIPLPQNQCLVCAVDSIRGHLMTNEVVVSSRGYTCLSNSRIALPWQQLFVWKLLLTGYLLPCRTSSLVLPAS